MSFFSNSNANRRIKRGGAKRQQSLLEVTARPDREQRRQSRRKIGGVFKAVLGLALIVGAVLGGKILINRLVWENPTYALDDIRVTTDGLLTRAQVLEIMEIQDGKNIFTVDLSRAKKALDLLPQVERVELRRVLPSRMDVRISERQPIAWVAPSADTELGVGGKAFLVDTRGYVMRTRKVLPEHLTLPILTGVVMEDVAPGQKLPTAEALSAIELLKLSVEDVRWQPRVVDVSKGYCLLVTDQRKAKVTFGFDNIEGQLARLKQIMDYVEPSQKEFQSVNLMLERSVPIVFAPPPAPVLAPQDSKTPKGKGGKAPSASGIGSVSGGVPSSAQNPPKVVAVIAASAPVNVSSVVPTPEPPSPFKLARTLPSAPPALPERAAPEKPKRRPVTRDEDERDDREEPASKAGKGAAVAAKGAKTTEKKSVERENIESRTEKPRASGPAVLQTKPDPVERRDPASLPPNESLRKLFNPHG